MELLYYRLYLAVKDLNSVLSPGDRAIYDARANLRFGVLAVALPVVILGLAYFGSLFGVLVSRRRKFAVSYELRAMKSAGDA